MTRVRALLALTLASFAALSLAAPAASAHPLGNFTVNLYRGIEVAPGAVSIRYVVDLAEIPTFQEGPNIDADGDGNQSAAERDAWARAKSIELQAGLILRDSGRPVALKGERAVVELLPGQADLPILRLEATFGAPIGRSGSITFEDRNYSDRLGWKEVTVRSASGLAIVGSTVPQRSVSDELRAYPDDMLASPLDVSSARFSFGPGSGSAPLAGTEVARASKPGGSGGLFTGLVNWRLTPMVLVASLFLAFVFGVGHALMPGHGKTITAAYLAASGARFRGAVVAGLVVSGMHTASVLVLGMVALVLFRSLAAERVYPWLGLLTGAVALGLGAWLLAARVRARSRGRGQHHHDGHGHEHAPVSRGGLLALAVAGGILPSPTALVVLTGAISYQRLGYGLALILAFSLGLAAALTMVGLAAVRVRSTLESRLIGRWAELIPMASAAAIAGVGAFFVLRALPQIS